MRDRAAPTPVEPASPAVTVRRNPGRARYDRDAVHAVLDAATVVHVGIAAADGRPVVVPMVHGRSGDDLFLHGSVASRLARSLGDGIDCCVSATLVDGLVLARSAFHHSINYRSVVVLGRAQRVDGEEALVGLRAITEGVLPGRWAEVRPPSAIELRQTSVLRLGLDEASVKVRTGGPNDEPDDLDLDVWAGVVPCSTAWGTPEAADDLGDGITVSPSVLGLGS